MDPGRIRGAELKPAVAARSVQRGCSTQARLAVDSPTDFPLTLATLTSKRTHEAATPSVAQRTD